MGHSVCLSMNKCYRLSLRLAEHEPNIIKNWVQLISIVPSTIYSFNNTLHTDMAFLKAIASTVSSWKWLSKLLQNATLVSPFESQIIPLEAEMCKEASVATSQLVLKKGASGGCHFKKEASGTSSGHAEQEADWNISNWERVELTSTLGSSNLFSKIT